GPTSPIFSAATTWVASICYSPTDRCDSCPIQSTLLSTARWEHVTVARRRLTFDLDDDDPLGPSGPTTDTRSCRQSFLKKAIRACDLAGTMKVSTLLRENPGHGQCASRFRVAA